MRLASFHASLTAVWTLWACLDTGLLGGRGCLTERLRLVFAFAACTGGPPETAWLAGGAGWQADQAHGKGLLPGPLLCNFLKKLRKFQFSEIKNYGFLSFLIISRPCYEKKAIH